MLLSTFSFLFLVPKDWSSSAQLLSVWSPFRFRFASAHPYECFLSGFLAEGAHLWLSALPYQILRWSCCCQLSRCKFLSLRTGLVLLLCRRVGKLSGFHPCGWILFSFPARPGLSVSDPFKPDYVSFLLLPSGLVHLPCHLRQVLLSVQNPVLISCCQFVFPFFFVI
jgi:hypothetical protein